MRKILIPALLLLFASLAQAQTSYQNGGNITSAGASCGNTNCVALEMPANSATLTVGVTGTFSATLAVEESQDGGFTWTSAGSSLTATGTSVYFVAGFTNFRVRASAFVSGNAGVNLQASIAASGGTSFGAGPPSGTCMASQQYVDTTGAALYICPNGTWIAVGSGGGGSTPRLDQILNPNVNKSFNLGTTTLAFTNGVMDLSGLTAPLTLPLVGACTPSTNGQICFDSTNLNYLGYNGAVQNFATFPSSVTSGDIVGFLKTGNTWTLQDLGPLNPSSGTGIVQATITNIVNGDSLCWDTGLGTFVNCTPGVPPTVISAATYNYDGTGSAAPERGDILFFTNAAGAALSLPQPTTGGVINANWFTFIKADGGTLTLTAGGTATFFDNGTNSLTIAKGTGCSIFSDPSGSGTYYTKCAMVPLTAGSGVTITPAAYSIAIAATGSGGTVTGSGTNNTMTKFTGSSSIGNSSMTDDGTNTVKAVNGLSVVSNSLDRQIANANPGSTLHRAVCINASSQAITCGTTALTGVAGTADEGAGNSGSVQVCIIGQCIAEFDGNATLGNWAILSTTTAGRFHDTGSTVEPTGQQAFYIYTSNAGGAGGTANIGILNPDVTSGGPNGGGRGTNVQINGTASLATLNLNGTTPAADANNRLLTYKSSASGSTTSATVEVPIASAAQGGIISAGGTAKQILVAGSPSGYIDLPDVKIIPAANCPNAVAGSGWSYATSTWTAACRAGSNNLGGALQLAPATGGAAQFRFEIPADWDSASQPFIRIEYASGANTSGTVIWTVASACTKGDGSVTDDPAFNAESAFGTQTMAAANRAWSQTGQFTAITSGNNCVSGGGLIIKVTLSGTASSAINAYQAVVTTPRLPVVQAN